MSCVARYIPLNPFGTLGADDPFHSLGTNVADPLVPSFQHMPTCVVEHVHMAKRKRLK